MSLSQSTVTWTPSSTSLMFTWYPTQYCLHIVPHTLTAFADPLIFLEQSPLSILFFWSSRHLVSKPFHFFSYRSIQFPWICSLAHVGIPEGAGVVPEKCGLCQCQRGTPGGRGVGRSSSHPTGPGRDEHHVGGSLRQICTETGASGWSSRGLLYFNVH